MKKVVSHLPKLIISKTTWKLIDQCYLVNTREVVMPSYSVRTYGQHRVLSSAEQFRRLQKFGLTRQMKVLDAGCGVGMLVAIGLKAGYQFYGYEVDQKAYQAALQLFRDNKLPLKYLQLVKDEVPFSKLKFDLITSFEVLEHVSDTVSYLKKIRQVIKSTGRLLIETPNYLIPYEPHYYLWLLGPRWLKWWQIRLAGRGNRQFFNELNFVTSRQVPRLLKEVGFSVNELGPEIWVRDLMGEPGSYRDPRFKAASRVVKLLKLRWLVEKLAKRGFYMPQLYLCRVNHR